MQFVIFFTIIAIVTYIIPFEVIQARSLTAVIFILSFYVLSRIYICLEMFFFPAKLNAHTLRRDRLKSLLIPVVGPIFSQFVHTTPVVETDMTLIDSSFDVERMKYYNNGIVFFNQLYERIEQAQQEIVLYFYIVGNDRLVEQFTKLLIKKHNEGVNVRIKVDALGMMDAYKSFYAMLKENNINIEIVSPTKYYDLNNILSYRTHKKFVIIDEEICFIGGMNLAQEYLGYSSKFGSWEDYMIKYKSKDLAKILKRDFLDKKFTIKKQHHNSRVIIENGCMNSTKIYNSFVRGIKEARNRIVIITPYISLTRELHELIQSKAKDIKVTFIVPGKSDGKFYAESVLKATLSQMENIEIREIENTFVHTKLYYFDDKVFFGSTNFDMRSFFINDEILIKTKTNFKFERELKRLFLISKETKYKKRKSMFRIFKDAM